MVSKQSTTINNNQQQSTINMTPTLKKDIIKTIVYSVFIMIFITLIVSTYRTLEYYEAMDKSCIKDK